MAIIVSNDSANTFEAVYRKGSYYRSTHADFMSVINDKGAMGEMRLCSALDRLPFGKLVLVNLYLKSQKFSTEIDIVCMTQKGVYVIESKNHGGKVYGDVNKSPWWEYYGRNKYELYSPVEQNKAHIQAIQYYFPRIPADRIFSITAFSDRCVLNIRGSVRNVYVIHRKHLSACVQHIEKSLDVYWEGEEFVELFLTMVPYTMADEQTKAEHVAYIKSLLQNR